MAGYKPLSKDGIPQALQMAMRYRLLNEPEAAESICLDILETDAQNQGALVTLLLAMTDRFGKGYAVGSTQVQEVLARLQNPYEQHYYRGIVLERKAKALLDQASPGARFDAYEWLLEAMQCYEKAEVLRPSGNDDAILRWNTCARIIKGNHLTTREREEREPSLE